MAKLLIVDDDKDLLSLLGEYLEAYGYEPVLVYCVAQARDQLEHFHFDAVVSDFIMPGESGLDLLDYVASRYPGLPFIMMTGSAMSQLKNEAMKRGSRGFIEKPFEFRDLSKTIAMVLDSLDSKDRELALTA